MSVTARAAPRILVDSPRLGTIPPRLSIVIVNYVHWDDTIRLVRALRSTDAVRSKQVEIIIIDNNSPYHPIIPRLRRMRGVSLLRWRKNRGFARAVNEACRLCRGDWFLLLNPDTDVGPAFLSHLLATIEAWPARTGIVGYGLTNPDGTRQLSTGRFPRLASCLGRLLLPRARSKYTAPPIDRVSEVDWVTGCCLLIQRDCFTDLGGLDPDFFLYYEDVDLCRRASAQGWTVWFDPQAWMTHHRPLHRRAVSPALRVFTRHALLTYADKHWGRWTRSALRGILHLEAGFRRLVARWRGDEEAVETFATLGHIVRDFGRGDVRQARARLHEVVRRQDRHHATHPLDRDPQPQSARPAPRLPEQYPEVCGGSARDRGRR